MTEYITTGGDQRSGHRICIYFDAYGNGVEDTWRSLDIMFNGLLKALKRMGSEMTSGKPEPL
ncbi:hypothetical protein AA464_28495 [Salmonella enterica subsp. enterica serovar Newport]|nr:hypothetical protein [Salmonella enterica subsp. enterica serovar Newport]